MPSRPPAPDYPVSATAQRPRWAELPLSVRTLIEQECGASVVAADSAPAGFTAGFASRLLLSDGGRVFVKAAAETEDTFANHAVTGYREEARRLVVLPEALPVPRLQWSRDTGQWVVLCLDDVAGRPPRRPWDPAELHRALDCLEDAADALTPAPPGVDWVRFVEDFGPQASRWDQLVDDDRLGPHAREAAALCGAGLAGVDGDTLVHGDVRDDNVIMGDTGQVWICDWNWPTRGAAWIDTLTLLLSARGDGLDADRLLAGRRLTADVGPDAIDGVLALLAGFFLVVQHDPVPAASPWIRHHQRWYGAVCWDWLCERRRWT